MKLLVREAHKDIDFSSIFLTIKTNNLLTKGFANLGEAINQMSNELNQSLTRLSNDLDELKDIQENQLSTLEGIRDDMEAEAQWNRQEAERLQQQHLEDSEQQKEETKRRIAHDEKTREMLDNIQRRKKPEDKWWFD